MRWTCHRLSNPSQMIPVPPTLESRQKSRHFGGYGISETADTLISPKISPPWRDSDGIRRAKRESCHLSCQAACRIALELNELARLCAEHQATVIFSAVKASSTATERSLRTWTQSSYLSVHARRLKLTVAEAKLTTCAWGAGSFVKPG
jgi:hypothetical protein